MNCSLSWRDSVAFALGVLQRYRFRTAMMLLAMTLAVGSVVAFTALGEGTRGFVQNEFSSLGTNLLVVLPGRKETTGGAPPTMGTATRDITLADVKALRTRLPGAQHVVPLMVGKIDVAAQGRIRSVMVLGTTAAYFPVRHLVVQSGDALPVMDDDLFQPVCVIGNTLRQALFGQGNAIGEWVRIADRRFRVIGVLGGKSDASGFDLSDAAIVPVAATQLLFNREGLFRVLVQPRFANNKTALKQALLDRFRELHQGIDDVTVVSPDSMLATFDKIFSALTLGIAAITGISLLVAGVLVMNLTWISVAQRTREIGLLKALGATRRQIRRLFLLESLLLCGIGAACGVVVGESLVLLGRVLWPTIPFAAPAWAVLTAVVMALLSGLVFAWLPATQASQKEPLAALASK